MDIIIVIVYSVTIDGVDGSAAAVAVELLWVEAPAGARAGL